MNKRQESLISLSSSENDLSETESDSEEAIVMRWVSNGNQMLTRALSLKDTHEGNKMRSSYTEKPTPCDPRIAKLKEKLKEKEKLLYQLEKQEKDFLGIDNNNKDNVIFRIEFEATTCKDYYLIPGCPETFIPAGKSLTIFGQLRNKRWRCVVENDDHLNNNTEKSSKEFPSVSLRKNADIEKTSDEFCEMPQGENCKPFVCCFPLIGSIPSSIIAELNESKDEQSDATTSEDEEWNTDTEEASRDKEHTNLSLCECGRHLPPSRNSLSRLQSCSFCRYCTVPSPIQTMTAEHLKGLNFQRFQSVSSVPLPPLPESPTESTIAELNMALESLAKITPRSRPVSKRSDSSRTSWTSHF